MTDDPASALYWLPLIEEANLPVPRTETVFYDHRKIFEEDAAYLTRLQQNVWAAARRVGIPAFLRTDLASAKHDGPEAYRLGAEEDVSRVVWRTVEDNELKFWPIGPTPRAFLIREWLYLDAPFTAFGGHPIAREWRLFASPEGIDCAHFYWPEEAIHRADREGWQDLLREMTESGYPETLEKDARRAAETCRAVDRWSVDFAQDTDENWVLIDMAPAETSWHPAHNDHSLPGGDAK